MLTTTALISFEYLECVWQVQYRLSISLQSCALGRLLCLVIMYAKNRKSILEQHTEKKNMLIARLIASKGN